jgi:uncharacterized membrane protein
MSVLLGIAAVIAGVLLILLATHHMQRQVSSDRDLFRGWLIVATVRVLSGPVVAAAGLCAGAFGVCQIAGCS